MHFLTRLIYAKHEFILIMCSIGDDNTSPISPFIPQWMDLITDQVIGHGKLCSQAGLFVSFVFHIRLYVPATDNTKFFNFINILCKIRAYKTFR